MEHRDNSTTRENVKLLQKIIHTKKSTKVITIILLIVLTICTSVVVTFFNQIRTSASIKQISPAPVYAAKVYGNFYLNDYLTAGAASYQELAKFCCNSFSHGWYDGSDLTHGCSGFFAKTPEGDYILAQDFDTAPMNQLPIVLETNADQKVLGISNCGFLKNDGKLSFDDRISMNAAPYFTMDGINENGLSVIIATAGDSSCTIDPQKTTLVSETVPIALLNKASTVEEAIALLKNYNIAKTINVCHFMIADTTGKSAVVEWVNGQMQVIYPDHNYQIFSNFILYKNEALAGFGSDRYRVYRNALNDCKGILTEDEALELLKSNTISDDACWSVVYNLTKKTMRVTFYKDYDHSYTYRLD